jgi:hypothetical protein
LKKVSNKLEDKKSITANNMDDIPTKLWTLLTNPHPLTLFIFGISRRINPSVPHFDIAPSILKKVNATSKSPYASEPYALITTQTNE